MADLTQKQELFCKEYIKDFNATRAAKAAGYSLGTAYNAGWQNVNKCDIQARLLELTKKQALKNEITVDRILQELSFIAFFDFRELFNDDGNLKQPHELNEKTARAIASVDVTEELDRRDKSVTAYIKKIKALDKKGALELLGKHLGMFAELIRIEDATTGFGKWLEGLYNALSDEGKIIYEQFATENPLSLEEYSFRSSWKKQGEWLN